LWGGTAGIRLGKTLEGAGVLPNQKKKKERKRLGLGHEPGDGEGENL